jgi:histidyl-tRNA synthetase
VQAGLRAIGVPFTIESKLVRGLDYYRRTTFEFQGLTLDSAQNALGGGGRYDGLVESLGGPSTHGIGFALGLDRTLLACDDEGVFAAEPQPVDVFVVDMTGGLEATKLTAEMRAAGLTAERAFDNRSVKSQMKGADRSGATFAVIIGSNELADGTVVLRPLRGERTDGDGQSIVARTDLIDHLKKALS